MDMEKATVFGYNKMGLQRLINTLGLAINESCKRIQCQNPKHQHDEQIRKFRLLPPRWEDGGK